MSQTRSRRLHSRGAARHATLQGIATLLTPTRVQGLLGRSCAGRWGQHLEPPGWQHPTCPQSRGAPLLSVTKAAMRGTLQGAMAKPPIPFTGRRFSAPVQAPAAQAQPGAQTKHIRITANSPSLELSMLLSLSSGLHWQGLLAASAARRRQMHAVTSKPPAAELSLQAGGRRMQGRRERLQYSHVLHQRLTCCSTANWQVWPHALSALGLLCLQLAAFARASDGSPVYSKWWQSMPPA